WLPVAGRARTLLGRAVVFRGVPVRAAGPPRRRRRVQSEPAEPVHDDPPAAALSRLRRADDPVRLRRRRAAVRTLRRALDRRDAAMDDPRLDGAWDRDSARRE